MVGRTAGEGYSLYVKFRRSGITDDQGSWLHHAQLGPLPQGVIHLAYLDEAAPSHHLQESAELYVYYCNYTNTQRRAAVLTSTRNKGSDGMRPYKEGARQLSEAAAAQHGAYMLKHLMRYPI